MLDREQVGAAPCQDVAKRERASVAVIAVHGVADQRRGETVTAVAVQLASLLKTSHASRELEVELSPLVPLENEYQRKLTTGPWERAKKSLEQSFRSDFLDKKVGGAQENDADSSAHRGWGDVGVRFTDYLLAKSHAAKLERTDSLRGPTVETTSVACAAVEPSDAKQPNIHLYEMFWADLSRVKSGVIGIVADLFTLLFLLSRIGMDALFVAHLQDKSGKLRGAAWAQRAVDWAFSRVLAPAAVQLLACALMMAPPTLLEDPPSSGTAAVVGGISVAGALAVLFVRRVRPRAGLAAAFMLVATLGVVALAVYAGDARAVLIPMTCWSILVALALWTFFSYCELRYRGVLGIGLVSTAFTLGTIWHEAKHDTAQGWIHGCGRAMEYWLIAHAWAWGVFGIMLVALVFTFELARLRRPAKPEALVTAQVSLFSSIGAYLMTLMVGLALISTALGPLLSKVDKGGKLIRAFRYHPFHFTTPGTWTAAEFLKQRASGSAISLTPITLLLLSLVGFALFVFAPSLLRELRISDGYRANTLGRWLTDGYRSIERWVRLWSYLIASAGLIIGWLLIHKTAGIGSPALPEWMHSARLVESCEALSEQGLSWFIYALGGGTVSLLAMGQLAIKRLRGVRMPLDAALDVGNHFAEFPRKAIVRARIFERYFALLKHVYAQGYESVVIVAHSQGTVITADLLRYLRQRAAKEPASEAGQVGAKLAEIPTRLLTVGSPLRQLYAMRFPNHYEWVLQHCGKFVGPNPADLNVQHWSNLWGTGDYVGRWLWALSTKLDPEALQDPSSYDPSGRISGSNWTDMSIGPDAHTHYFDRDQREVARELWRLICLEPQGADEGEPPSSPNDDESDRPPAANRPPEGPTMMTESG